jgi:GNAT superfamily N-acetyltransferase
MTNPTVRLDIRHPTLDDLPDVLHVQRASRSYDAGSTSLTEAALLASWQSGKLALDADAWLATTPEGAAIAYADITPDAGDFWVSLFVQPDHRDHGVEQLLLAQAEQRVTERKSTPTPVTLFARAFDVNRSAQAAFEQSGFAHDLSFQIMQIELEHVPPTPMPIWPEGVVVRPFNPGPDDQPTYAADEESAEDKGYHAPLTYDGWAERMGRYKPSFDPTLWFLAWDGPDLAALCLNYYDSAARKGWIDHLGVRRPWRKRGLGMALLLHSFQEFHARGIYTVELSVDSASLTNAPRLYTAAGMQVVQKYHIYRKAL